MDENKNKVTEHRPHRGGWLFGERAEQRLHEGRDRFNRRGDMLRAPDENPPLTVTGERGGGQDVGLHGGAEERAIPVLQVAVHDLAGRPPLRGG